jgi:hypothetical protein
MSSKWTPLVACLGLALILIGISAIFDRWKSGQTYGDVYNEERKKMGIPPVEKGWVFSKGEVDKQKQQYLNWFKIEQPQAELLEILPEHSGKTIILTNGKRSLERDIYSYRNNGQFHTLTLSYDFDTKKWDSSLEIDCNADILQLMNDEIQQRIGKLSLSKQLIAAHRQQIQDEVAGKYQKKMEAPATIYFETNALQQADSVLKSWHLERIKP